MHAVRIKCQKSYKHITKNTQRNASHLNSWHSFLTPSGQCTSTHLCIKDTAEGYAKLIVQVDAVIATIMQNLKHKMVLF